MESSFSLVSSLRSILSRQDGDNTFEALIRDIETYHGRQVSSMHDLKARDNKKLKGDLFEEFCQLYLQAGGKYKTVWLWKEVP